MIADLKPYPAMKDSGLPWLGAVPEHWEVRRLGTSVHGCINGIWGNDPNGREDLPCVRVADFDRARLRVRLAKPTLRAVAPGERKRRLLKKSDLLLEKSGGGDLQPVGVVMLYDHDIEAVCSNFVARMPVSARCNSSYLTYLHSHLYAIRLNVRSIKQTTGIQNLDSSSYLGEPVAFPPLSEQTAIVRFLDHADRRIRRYIRAKQKLIKLLEEQKQVIVHRAVTRGLDPNVRLKPSGVPWLGDVPAHWEVKRGKALFHCVDVRSSTGEEELLTVSSEHGVVPRSSATVTMFKAESYAGYKLCWPGDLVINSLWAWGRGLGVSRHHGIISSAYGVYRLRSSYTEYSAYVHELVRSVPFNWELQVRSKGIWISRLQLTDEAFLGAPFPLPPLPEQAAIVRYLDKATSDIDAAIDRARRQVELLSEYRTRLIADVVTGKLDVREEVDRMPDEAEKPEPIEEDEEWSEPVDDDIELPEALH